MPLTITALVENHPGEHKALIHEHGLSLHIDTGTHRILFDTGQSDALIHNARQLGISLADLDYVVISHGHYDHSGGFTALARAASGFKLVTGQGFFEKKFARAGHSREFLGNSFGPDFLREKGIGHVTPDRDLMALCPGVYVLSGFPRKHGDETVNPRFKLLKNGAFRDDPFDDEIMLALNTPRGLVAVLGCSHPGMKNMLDAVRERLKKPIHAVMGGTHLVEADARSLERSVDYLEKHGVNIVGVSHCTGDAAMAALARRTRAFTQIRTGSSLCIE